jgi:tRNA A37 threonylcarbamoyladenosine dehydratase
MSSFKYPDTNSSRAQIEDLNIKFKDQKIAIIGLGGTGSYILDLISKTPVKEIHLYDDDIFQVHNAFRAPGAVPSEKFEDEPNIKKVWYFHEIYSNIHNGIVPHDTCVSGENVKEMKNFSFIFLSIDSTGSKSIIIDKLIEYKVPFIDVGLGVQRVNDLLIGTIRVTTATNAKNDHLKNRISMESETQNEYSSNIQIADLNSLNAALAVIKWKKLIGFYQDLKQENNALYFISTDKLLNEDFQAPIC